MFGKTGRPHAYLLVLAIIAAHGALAAWAATKAVNLDGNSANGAESSCTLTILRTFPAKIENKVTNKAVGANFLFDWKSAGPAGFRAFTGLGTSVGVGGKWTWETASTVYSFTGNSCANDICFTKTTAPNLGTVLGPFGVPGRSLIPSGVTLSNASLTSSLIQFFSPPKTIFEVTSSIGQVASGQIGYNTSVASSAPTNVTFQIPAWPAGCCNDVHQLNCDGECVYYLTDPLNCGACGNVCGEGSFCSEGTCVTVCPVGTTLCGETCVDLLSDPANCGACGNACGDNQICTDGACVTCRPPEQTACDNRCVNIHTDAENCGACGINCNFLCPSTGQGTCSQGNSCLCISPEGDAAQFFSLDAGEAAAPQRPGRPARSAAFDGVEDLKSRLPRRAARTSPVDTAKAEMSGQTASLDTVEVVEAPLCETQEILETLAPGETFSDCRTSGLLAKEVQNQVSVCEGGNPVGPDGLCDDGQPPSQGTYVELIPDMTKPIPPVFLSPFAVAIQDATGDGLFQPFETAKVWISVVNAGVDGLTGAAATLSSPPVDLTDDGVVNPVEVTIANAVQAYGGVPGHPGGGGGCDSPSLEPVPATNTSPFVVTLGSHPGDVSRPFVLSFTGNSPSGPFSMDVPITLGIAGQCDPALLEGNYDGVAGLESPMARLVPEEESPVFPAKAFQLGKSRPLKLRLLCGGVSLTGSMIDPPEIVGLSEASLGDLDIHTLNLNDGANANDPFFSYNASNKNWNYSMRTKDLARVLMLAGQSQGVFTLKIRIAGRKDYVTGFVLQ